MAHQVDFDETLVRVELSSKMFAGYLIWLNPAKFDTIESIAAHCHQHLLSMLTEHNLVDLLRKARRLCFHVHDATLEDFRNHTLDVFFVCDHC